MPVRYGVWYGAAPFPETPPKHPQRPVDPDLDLTPSKDSLPSDVDDESNVGTHVSSATTLVLSPHPHPYRRERALVAGNPGLTEGVESTGGNTSVVDEQNDVLPENPPLDRFTVSESGMLRLVRSKKTRKKSEKDMVKGVQKKPSTSTSRMMKKPATSSSRMTMKKPASKPAPAKTPAKKPAAASVAPNMKVKP